MSAVERMMSVWETVKDASIKLNTAPDGLGDAVDKLIADSRELRRDLDSVKKGLVGETVEDLVAKASQVNGVRVVRHMQSEDMRHLVALAKQVIAQPKTVAVLGSDQGGAKVVVARSQDVALDCRTAVSEAMKVAGGSGGGKPDFAQGGGPDAAKIEQALDSAAEAVRKALGEE